MIKQKMTYFFVIAVYFMTTVAVFAQDEFPEDEEGPEGPPAASINSYLILLAVIGIAFAWKAFTKARSGSQQVNA